MESDANATWGIPALVLNPRSPVSLWTQLARALRERIVQRNLPVHAPLPSEQFLADEYNLSRNTVRRAYQALQDSGQVGSRQGSGFFVAEQVEMQYVQVLPGARISFAAADPDHMSDIPWWLASAIKIEPPPEEALDPMWYDPTRTTLIVS